MDAAGVEVDVTPAQRAEQLAHALGVRDLPRLRGQRRAAQSEQETKTVAGTRTTPLVGRLRADLARHKLATGRGAAELCFGRTTSSAFVRSTLRSRALAAWGEAKLSPLTPHEARHTCASYLAAAGLTPKEAQTAMGHADIRTTLNIYAKAVPGWEEGATAKLDAYLDGGPRDTDATMGPASMRSTAVEGGRTSPV